MEVSHHNVALLDPHSKDGYKKRRGTEIGRMVGQLQSGLNKTSAFFLFGNRLRLSGW